MSQKPARKKTNYKKNKKNSFKNFLKFFLVIPVFLLFFFVFFSNTHAANGINKQINFQGKLVDNNGLNVADSTYTVIFSMYNVSSAGTAAWTETDTVTTVAGVFQVPLGAITSLAGFDFNQDTWYLGIKVGADAEMTPRIRYSAVPFAFNANTLDGVVATQSASGFTLTGGYQTQKTLTLNDNISLGTIIQPTLANALQVQSTGANALTLDTGGSAAINIGLLNATSLVFGNTTTNPSFAVTGTGAFTVNGGGNNNITLGGSTGTGNIVIQPNAGGQAALIIKDQGLGDLFTASAGATPEFVIKNNGFVGIGTNSPGTNALQVNGGPVYVNGNGITADGTVRSNNLFWLSNGGTGISPVLRLEDYSTTSTGLAESAKLAGTDSTETEWQAIQILKEQIWTGVATTRNSAFVISNLLNNATAESARFTSSGTLAIGTQTPLTSSGLDIEKDTLGNATLVVNQKSLGPGQGDILTASSSGASRFAIANDGTLKMFGTTSGYTGFVAPATAPSLIYTLPTTAPTSGYVLSSTNTGTLSWIAGGGGGGCATCLQQVPANTAANTITVGATASTVGLTINNSTNATTADALDINMVQGSGTATNGLSITENTGTGVTTNGIQITQGGTATITNGLALTGTFTNLINATNFNVSNAGMVTIASGQSYTGAGAVTVDSASAAALNLGNTNANAVTLGNIANTTTIGINTSASTGNGVTLTANSVTTGAGLLITSTGVTQGAGVLTQITDNNATTGKLLAVNGIGLTTGYGIYVTGGSSVTQGGDLYLNGAIYRHTTAETGSLATVAFNDQSTDTNGADTTISNGLNVLTQFTTTGSAAKNINAVNIAAPSTQSCTSGLCTWEGLKITTPASATNVTAGGISVVAGGVPGTDMVNITNAGQGVTTAGINALSINYIGGAAAVESAAQRIDLTPGTTSGGTWSGLRVVANTTGPVTGVTEYGLKIESPTNAFAGTFNGLYVGGSVGGTSIQVNSTINVPTIDQVNITNASSTGVITAGVNALSINYKGGAAAVESAAQRIDLTPGTTSGGTWSGLRIVENATGAVTGVTEAGVKLEGPTAPGAGNEYAIYIPTAAKWDNILEVAASAIINGSGILQSVGLSGTYSNSLTFSSTANTISATTLTLLGGQAADIKTNSGTSLKMDTGGAAAITIGGTNATGLTLGRGALETITLTIGSDATGDMFYRNSSSNLARLADVATGSCLISGGVGAIPSWGACSGAGGARLDQVTAATATSTIANANNAITWNWAPSTTAQTNFTFGTTAAATSGTQTGLAVSLTHTSNIVTNGVLVNENGTGGTVTNGMQISNTAGTMTNGLTFTGTMTSNILGTNGLSMTTGAGQAMTLNTANGGLNNSAGALGITSGNGGGGVSGGSGGAITITAGSGTANGAGGAITLNAGTGSSGGGNMSITAGSNSSSGQSGLLTLDSGYNNNLSVGGTINIGALNAGTINFGSTTNNTNIVFKNSETIDFASGTAGNTETWKFPTKSSGTCISGGAEGIIFKDSGGTQRGHACIDSGTPLLKFYANQFNTAATDVAENYSDSTNNLEAGDIVALDNATLKGVKKINSIYSQDIFGVISTNPGILLTDINDSNKVTDLINPKPVALTGRIPTKVSTENGSISVGDYITISSIAGVGMKATHASYVIGQALENYSEKGVGKILVFARTSYFNGLTNDAIAAGLSGDTSVAPFIGSTILNAIQITSDGKVVINADNPEKAITFDKYGNATFAGIISAKAIKTDQIIGLDLITDKLATLSASIASLSGELQNIPVSTSATPDVLHLATLTVDSVATISGNLRVQQNALFEGMLHVVDTITTSNLLVSKVADFFGTVFFHGDVNFAGHITFNSDTAGFALIKKDANRVDVTFTKEYSTTPIITATISVQKVTEASSQAALEQEILQANYGYIVTNKTKNGFTILLSKKATTDVELSWSAVAIDNAQTFQSDGTVPAQQITPSISPTIFLLPTPVVTIIPSP